MILNSFIIPHSPILIPNIGKKNKEILEKTSKSFAEIKQVIKDSKIENIIIISPGTNNKEKEISINSHFQYDIRFENFGDYFSKIKLKGNPRLSYLLKEVSEDEFKVGLYSENKISYSSGIPLYLCLSEQNQKIKEFNGKILEIKTSNHKDLEHHFNFGKKIHKKIEEEENVLILCSAEMSHSLSQRSPGGFYQKAEQFDNRIIEMIKKEGGYEEIIKTKEESMKNSKECALRQVSMLLGIINEKKYKAETMSYQKDLGIGYLSMNIKIS